MFMVKKFSLLVKNKKKSIQTYQCLTSLRLQAYAAQRRPNTKHCQNVFCSPSFQQQQIRDKDEAGQFDLYVQTLHSSGIQKHCCTYTQSQSLIFFHEKIINVVLLQCCVLHVRLNWLFENVRTANVLQCYATIVYSSTYLLQMEGTRFQSNNKRGSPHPKIRKHQDEAQIIIHYLHPTLII